MKHKNIIRIFIGLTYVLACFPVLTFVIRSILTILWSVIGIFLFLKSDNNFVKQKDVWFFVLPFFILLASLCYSQNVSSGFYLLKTMLTFILIPIIIYSNRKYFLKNEINKILYIFSSAVLLLIVYQLFFIIKDWDVLIGQITSQELKSNGFASLSEISDYKINQIKVRRFRNYIIQLSNTHTTYQGIWISFCLFFLIMQMVKKNRLMSKLFISFAILILLIWMFLISARMPLFATIVSGLLSVFLYSKFTKRYKFIFIFTTSIIISFLIFTKNPISTRFLETYNNGLTILNSNEKVGDFNSTNVRIGVYYCDLFVLKKNFLLGVGIGDIQEELNNCYNDNIGADIYNWRKYNTHNQFLFFWLSAGIPGILSIILLIGFYVKQAFKKKNVYLFYFLSMCFFVFLTENILERSDGVIFFSLFLPLLHLRKK